MDAAANFIERTGYLFYIASPNRTSFATPEEVPDYVIQVVPHFILLLLLEYFVRIYQKKPAVRVNDAVASISQGLLLELSKIVIRSVQFAAYIYVYNNWRLMTLPWNSVWTWWFTFLGEDFAYYWLHRASHEINILWASHQVHHSSEEYNLTTALRQSVVQHYVVWIFSIPLAFAVPPGVYIVHNQFNLLFQFWLHTEVIKSLGPLEYVLNTASHHRVHHGRNRYCIDKNYGGTLIIWDRIFGTFEPESETVVYGLTHPIQTFEPFYIQLCHYLHILRSFWETKGIGNKLSVLLKGPGWSPGTPWHGNIEDIPDVKYPVEIYDPHIPRWYTGYIFFHFALLIVGFVELSERGFLYSQGFVYSAILYETFSMAVIGMMLDGKLFAPWMEVFRCCLFFVLDYYFLPFGGLAVSVAYKGLLIMIVRLIFATSAVFWLQYCVRNISVTVRSSTEKKLK